MQFLKVNGVVLHYALRAVETGRPAIVSINSLGTDARIWDQVADKLSRDHTVLTYDKRGHGLSDLGSPPYSIADHAADLAGLLDHLGLSQVIVCGLSVGGLIAQALYAGRPDLVKALVLSNTAHKIGTSDMWAARMATVERDGIGSILDAVMERWFTAAFRDPDNAAYAAYRNMLLRQPAEGYSGTCAAIRDADLTEDARRIAVPTLCIAGSDDGSTPPSLVRSLADLVPDARYVLIDNTAHIPCVEAPAAYAAVLENFIETIG